jgi:hypothetical protein
MLHSGKVKLYCGACLDVMGSMKADSIDSIVTKPPPCLPTSHWKNVLRILKTGCHLAAVCLPQNYHLLAHTIESAGFEFRGTLFDAARTICHSPDGMVVTPSIWIMLARKSWSTKPDQGSLIKDHFDRPFFFDTDRGSLDDPLSVIQWLVRTLTAKGETVLDPFAGTGITAEAAVREGRSCILIENNHKCQDDIKRRIAALPRAD